MNELALFAGAGGGILGGILSGWRTVCAVEIDAYATSVLAVRQNDRVLPPFPIWDDVRTFDGRPWRGIVDVVSGGFPCTDISIAGKGAGIGGKESGLWKEMARIIGEVRPRYAFVENSPMLISRGLTTVLSDLAEIGYDAVWTIIGADDCGAPHRRKRIWILGYTNDYGQSPAKGRGGTTKRVYPCETGKIEARKFERSGIEYAELAYPEKPGLERRRRITEGTEISGSRDGCSLADTTNEGDVRRNGELESIERQMRIGNGSEGDGSGKWWASEPYVGRVAHGVAARVDRLKAIGNGQVPVVAATAWNILIREVYEK